MKTPFEARAALALEEGIEACVFVCTRMPNEFVLATGDGEVVYSDGHIGPISTVVGDIYRTFKADRARAVLADLKAGNLDNAAVQTLRVAFIRDVATDQECRQRELLEAFRA